MIEKPPQNTSRTLKHHSMSSVSECALTEFFDGHDLILAHALTGLVVGQSPRVKKTTLDAFPEEKHLERSFKP